jgi:two-component system, LytTR family, response regulator
MEGQIKAIIVDDEVNARLVLKGMLEELYPEVVIAAEAKNIPEAVKAIHKHEPNLVFLDIEMPGHSGLEILEFFDRDNIKFKIIFVTAYSEYAINAFELSAIDYLLKPVRKEHLQRAISRLEPNVTHNYNTLFNNLYEPNNKKIVLKTGDGMLFINLDEIIYLKADGSYTNFYLTDGQVILVSKKLIEYERLEQIGRFMRIHRSHIINLNHIKKILKADGGFIVMSNNEELSISMEKRQFLLDKIAEEKI